jgi:hypothetical protein
MPKRKKCRCSELRSEVRWHRNRAALMQGVLRRLIDSEDERRARARDYERAILDARGLLNLDVGGRDDER